MNLSKIYALQSEVDKYDYITIALIFIFSIILSNILITIDFFIPRGVKFNIFEVIPLYKWIILILLNIFFLSMIRSSLLLMFRKDEYKKSFLGIVIHIIKYGLLAIPFLFPLIMILANKIVLENFNNSAIDINEPILIGLIYSMCFTILWILFLGMTIKSSILKQYTFFKGVMINLTTSILTIFIVGYISFNSIISIEKYEIPMIKKILTIQVELKLITEEQRNIAFKRYIQEKSNK